LLYFDTIFINENINCTDVDARINPADIIAITEDSNNSYVELFKGSFLRYISVYVLLKKLIRNCTRKITTLLK